MKEYNDNLFKGANKTIFEFSRELRQRQTETESIMWEYLRNRKLIVKFRRQHPIGNYIADFYCHEKKMIVEIDGEIHNSVPSIEYDRTRTEILNEQGITVLRFTNQQVKTDLINVLQNIIDFIKYN